MFCFLYALHIIGSFKPTDYLYNKNKDSHILTVALLLPADLHLLFVQAKCRFSHDRAHLRVIEKL